MSPLKAKIAAEIEQKGPIPFVRFMELALYCPVYGYYEMEEDKVGKGGDYYTSVSVGPLFGQLLAAQFAEWIQTLTREPGDEVLLVEAGAHNGRLAADVLAWFETQAPKLFERLRYCVIEPSRRRKAWQEETLKRFAPRVVWLEALEAMRAGGQALLSKIIFSNELLDAMPVRRLGWDAKREKWFEWGVGLRKNGFGWERLMELDAGAPLAAGLERIPPGLREVLTDAFTVDISTAAISWWASAAGILNRGYLMTCDYGLASAEFLAPHRSKGTLRGYYRHKVTEDILARPGEQDLTAHVDFTCLQEAGERAGLETLGLTSQGQFLTKIAEKVWTGKMRFEPWSIKHTAQFRTLTHPEHLGQVFKVLIQRRV